MEKETVDKYTIGVDFGTSSVRALVVNCSTGAEVATATYHYPSGHQGVLIDTNDHHLARQSPLDYIDGLEKTIVEALAKAKNYSHFSANNVIGIGVDSTGSSPIPVDHQNQALALNPKWKNNLGAQCWLWKDHTSYQEAAEITRLAKLHRPQYIAKCGNTYSSEWWWSKLWKCLKTYPEVFQAAHSWVELCDFIPALLAGINDPKQIKRGMCAAGHKAFFSDEWGGLPDKEFLGMLDTRLADLRDRLFERAWDASHTAGNLCEEWSTRLGLPAGIPIAIGQFDVHYGAIGADVAEGVLVKVIGTSTCDCAVVSAEQKIADVPGICGIVNGSILPGYYGVEAGQSAVGDIFNWYVDRVCLGDAQLHQQLVSEVENQRPGQSGLLALDWNNGNRTILVDPLLSGLLVGQSLHTSRAEIYRALIEGTAFGARAIIERMREYQIPINQIVCCGGIAEKNPFLMQIYADITGCELQVAQSTQTCALGAAIGAAVAAGESRGGYSDFLAAQKRMSSPKARTYFPIPENVKIYDQLYRLYRQLHDAFGGLNKNADLSSLMKELLALKEYANEKIESKRNLVRDRDSASLRGEGASRSSL